MKLDYEYARFAAKKAAELLRKYRYVIYER